MDARPREKLIKDTFRTDSQVSNVDVEPSEFQSSADRGGTDLKRQWGSPRMGVEGADS
jgi:hypothetical protein